MIAGKNGKQRGELSGNHPHRAESATGMGHMPAALSMLSGAGGRGITKFLFSKTLRRMNS
jgi:hypothetical protein